MRIIQLLPILSYGDAVGNDAIALQNALKKAGYKAGLYASVVDNRLPVGLAKSVDDIGIIAEEDLIIYHLSTGHALNDYIKSVPGIKVIVYHNITPAEYFSGYKMEAELACKNGRKALKELAQYADYAIADSEYNKLELIENGYQCPIEVLPILIPFEDYESKVDRGIIKKYKDNYTNILFTGRVVPNKKHEDLIDTFYYYKKFINPKSRLILVGSFAGIDLYHNELEAYVKELGLEDVVFTGHIKFNQILAFYKCADVFLCMSEHEGFCVPLIEAMYFDLPIVARNTSAIAGTLNGSGLLLEDSNPIVAAEMINKIITDSNLKTEVIENQKKRLMDFDNGIVENQFLKIVNGIVRSHDIP